MNKHKQQYLDFEAYERVAEPHKRERASVWRTAIGLQDVDGLKVSDYLKETAVRHIEGDITIDDVREQLKSYYVNKTTHYEDDAEKEEAACSRAYSNMQVNCGPMTSAKRNGCYLAIVLCMDVLPTL